MRGKTLIIVGMTLALPFSCSAIGFLMPGAESLVSDSVTKAAAAIMIPAVIIVVGILLVSVSKINKG